MEKEQKERKRNLGTRKSGIPQVENKNRRTVNVWRNYKPKARFHSVKLEMNK